MCVGDKIFKKMLVAVKVRYLLCAIGIFLTCISALAQSDGAELFDEYCADCHSVGEGDMKGPDLLGVKKRHAREWLIKFIKSSKEMIKSGDAEAVAIFEKFKKKKMSSTNLPTEDIVLIINYIESFSKSDPPPQEVPIAVQVDKTQGSSPAANTSPAPVQLIPASSNASDEKIKTLEGKLDILLKYHRRMASIEITEEDILKGKNLFNGEIPFLNGAFSCVSCHNTLEIDSLNWNPSAYDLATKHTLNNIENMEQVLAKPTSRKMKEVLEGHELTDREQYTVAAYLQTVGESGLEPTRKPHQNLLIFIGLGLVILLSLIDLIFTKKLKPKIIPILLILICSVVEAQTIVEEVLNLGFSEGYEPDQPIKFSHKIHAGENGIECLYCHSTPEYSKISGIPYDDICINCHNKIKSGTNSGTFEIAKILHSIEAKEPIKWIKIHNLPDHVFYSHAQHVGAGKIDCKTCHGEVEKMDRVRQVSSLSMQWCIDCHREREVQFMDNEYYQHFVQLHDDMESGKINRVTVDDIGGDDCQRCHY